MLCLFFFFLPCHSGFFNLLVCLLSIKEPGEAALCPLGVTGCALGGGCWSRLLGLHPAWSNQLVPRAGGWGPGPGDSSHVSASARRLGAMELSLGSSLSSRTQPEGFFLPCQDLIMCSLFYQNAEQQLNIGCSSIDYGISNGALHYTRDLY